MKLKEFKRFQDMDEENRKIAAGILGKIYPKETRDFIVSNKAFIEQQLSRSNVTLFRNQVIKDDEIKVPFLAMILSKLDKERNDKFVSKIIKTICKNDKELGERIIAGEEFSEERLATCLLKNNEEDIKYIGQFLLFLGIDLDPIENLLKEQKEKLEKEKTKEELLKREKEIEKQAKQIENIKKKYNESIKKQKAEFDQELKKKNQEYEALKLKNATLEKELKKKQTETKPEEKQNNAAPDQEVRVDGENNQKILVDFETILNDLESKTFLGTVKIQDIRIDKSWIIVTPIVPILSDKVNFDKEQFFSRVDYRGDYSTFILFIDEDLLTVLFRKEEAYNYFYLDDDEKLNCLYKALCGKTLFFTPSFYFDQKDQIYKLNARLISKPVNSGDFANSTFVPFFEGTKKAFESLVSSHQNLILENYPYGLSSNLKYIFVADTLYQINYLPCQKDGENNIIWKFNGQEGKEPFQKLSLKIIDAISADYIVVPDQDGKTIGAYVKNLSFIKATSKSSLVFDEQDFLKSVNENAKSRNLYYSDEDVKKFHIAIKSSYLVILAGPSGIGKTKLPMIYANSLGLDAAKNSVLFVSISPSFLEPEDVLGYVRPLNDPSSPFNAEYMEAQTGLVSFLADAAEHKDKIHFVIFDEMNLSQIEYWFAPFISLLEQDSDVRELKLYSKNLRVKNEDDYPSSIVIGNNVFFIGTINIDETTKPISDRLLDRAITINLSTPSFKNLKEMGTANVDLYPEISYSRFASSIQTIKNPASELSERELSLVDSFNTALSASCYSRTISFRTLNKIALFLKNSANVLPRSTAIDFIVSQMIVKRLRGPKEELDDILSDDDAVGLLKLLNDFNDLSTFDESIKFIKKKVQEINKNGFAR